MGKTKLGKGIKIMAITDAGVAILSIASKSSSPHEVTLMEQTPEERFTNALPEKLIGDKAYDSYELDRRLVKMQVEMIAPHKKQPEETTDTG